MQRDLGCVGKRAARGILGHGDRLARHDRFGANGHDAKDETASGHQQSSSSVASSIRLLVAHATRKGQGFTGGRETFHGENSS